MVADAPFSRIQWNVTAKKGTPQWLFKAIFIKSDSKNNLAQQGPDEAAERPNRGGTLQEQKMR